MRKFSWMFLVLLAFSVYAEDEDLLVVGSAKELKGITAKKIIWKKDGARMALIPGGSFEMGDHYRTHPVLRDKSNSDAPVHRVELDAFYIDIHEVTVGKYKKFLSETGYKQPDWNDVTKYSSGDDYPMIFVDWHDASAYCEWAGKRLPTEAEWEYAARGGSVGKRYPWGNEITHNDANYMGIGGEDKWESCAPVGSFKANSFGLYDVVGNVVEWCQDWYDGDYYSNSPAKNPSGPKTGEQIRHLGGECRAMRGGGWGYSYYGLPLGTRGRANPGNANEVNGFRCVVSAFDYP